jgi:hypothetical protein
LAWSQVAGNPRIDYSENARQISVSHGMTNIDIETVYDWYASLLHIYSRLDDARRWLEWHFTLPVC